MIYNIEKTDSIIYNKYDAFLCFKYDNGENIMEDKWINTNEAADYLGVKATTIREWIKRNNGIPAHKIGRLWKFKKNELDDWIKSGKSAELI